MSCPSGGIKDDRLLLGVYPSAGGDAIGDANVDRNDTEEPVRPILDLLGMDSGSRSSSSSSMFGC